MVIDCHAYAWHEKDDEYPECGPDNLARMKAEFNVTVEHLPDGPPEYPGWADWAWWYRLTGEREDIINLLTAEYTGSRPEAEELVDG